LDAKNGWQDKYSGLLQKYHCHELPAGLFRVDGSRLRVPGGWMLILGAERSILDAGYWMLDTGLSIQYPAPLIDGLLPKSNFIC